MGWWNGRPIEAAWRRVTVYLATCPEPTCGWRTSWHTKVLPDLYEEMQQHLREEHGA